MSLDESRQTHVSGLPSWPRYEQKLLFVPQTKTLLLTFSVERDGGTVPCVFGRQAEATRYENILEWVGKPDTMEQEDEWTGVKPPVVTADGTMYVLLYCYKRRERGLGARLLTTVRIHLPSRSAEEWNPEVDGADPCCPVELVGVDDAGPYAKASFKVAEQDGSGWTFDYAIAHLDWQKRKVRKVALLPGVFF